MFNTFKEVEDHYNIIRPLVSKYHPKEQDVRPIGLRRFKWERIEKIDDNTYALWSGYTDGDDVFPPTREGVKFTDAEKIALAPIVWQRRPNGDEMVKLRAPFYKYSTGYYSFLKAYSPRRIDVINSGSGQWHAVPASGKHRGAKFLLAYPSNISEAASELSGRHWRGAAGQGSVDGRDTSLTFVLRNGEWHPYDAYTKGALKKYARRVDTERKAKLKPFIREFWDWFAAIQPMLPNTNDRGGYSSSYQMLSSYGDQIRAKYNVKYYSVKCLTDDLIEIMVSDPESPLRMHLALYLHNNLFLPTESTYDRYTRTWEHSYPTPKQVRARYNREMNNLLKLISKKEVDA